MKTLVTLTLAGAALAALAIFASRHAPQSTPSASPPLQKPVPMPREDLPAPAPSPKPLSNAERSWQLVQEIERALVSQDEAVREQALSVLLPELVALDPSTAALMVEKCEPGPSREELRRALLHAWAAADATAAIDWVTRLADADEQWRAAIEATDEIGKSDPARFIEVSDRFGLNRDDGRSEHAVQLWATEDLPAALDWIQTQPAGPARDPLVARIALVQAQSQPGEAARLVLDAMTAGDRQIEALLAVLHEWAVRDPEGATQWLQQFPAGQLRERGSATLAQVARQREAAALN